MTDKYVTLASAVLAKIYMTNDHDATALKYIAAAIADAVAQDRAERVHQNVQNTQKRTSECTSDERDRFEAAWQGVSEWKASEKNTAWHLWQVCASQQRSLAKAEDERGRAENLILPSDEEIEQASLTVEFYKVDQTDFVSGAEWLRSQIKPAPTAKPLMKEILEAADELRHTPKWAGIVAKIETVLWKQGDIE